MEVTLALLADAANTTDNGKLNLLGVFQTINAPEVPCQHPQMSLVVILLASPGEKGITKSVEVKLVDQDGKPVAGSPALNVTIPADDPRLRPELNLVFNLANLVFPKYGTYHFDILVNGDSKKLVDLVVQPIALPSAE